MGNKEAKEVAQMKLMQFDAPLQTHMFFIDAFLQNNRLDQVTQEMGYHPTYLDIFLRTQQFILRGDGPLPYDYRHFIAIMAAGRHGCGYLINQQRQEFLLQGGEASWLRGLAHIPPKLRDLYEINKILAHRPWLLNKNHIQRLTKGSDSWSLAEVVHAIVLLTHFHALSSFVFGCGVTEEGEEGEEEEKMGGGGGEEGRGGGGGTEPPRSGGGNWEIGVATIGSKQLNGATNKSGGEVGWSEVGVESLMEKMKTLSEQREETSETERAKRFERVQELQEVDGRTLTSPSLRRPPPRLLLGSVFVEDPDFIYEDFARRGETSEIPTFRVQDYSWDDHGFSLVNRLYSDVGNLLDEKFKTAYNLTYYTMGGRKDVDTSRFRRAIWNYIQCIYGIRHDDYDYGEVNQLLERSLKAFIKLACCFPERVTKADYDRVLREFKHSEKVHVNIMILEARMQAELLYALRAVMRYTMT